MNDLELNTVSNSNRHYSVKVQNAYKRYTPTSVVLNGLNMNVPDGCIYALLGPSGCGKTTLLNCIVGKSKLDSGIISLKINKLRAIGYMPQTLSLHTQMTIKENISFYGYLFGMQSQELKNRVNEYVTFLELPDKHRFVGELSEGQKRRVSLIITLIHDPEILILDEPTVGMDLIISDKIWKRLLLMAASGKSIIITTHYIQEAQQAHKIGLMREGVLLAEESPQQLMERCGCDDLETVFLQLSKRQETSTFSLQAYPEDQEAISQPFKDDRMFTRKKIRGIFYKDIALLKRGYTDTLVIYMSTHVSLPRAPMHRLVQNGFGSSIPVQQDVGEPVLEYKDVWQTKEWPARLITSRRMMRLFYFGYPHDMMPPRFLIFSLLLSTVTLTVFNVIIGKPPKNLRIGVINDESSLNKCNLKDIHVCFLNQSTSILFSCLLTDFLRNETYEVVEYQSEAKAVQDFKKNKIYAVLHFPQNYTAALSRRFTKFMENFDPKIIEQSLLDFWVDRSNKYMEIFITVDVVMAMFAFIKRVLTNCHLNPRIVTPPVFFEEPIYGSMEDTFTSYTLIPFIFVNTFIWPMVSIAVFFLAEKTSGIMDRVLLTGTSILDMMSSFFMIQFVLQFFSTLITLVVIFGIFDNSMDGSMFQFTILLMLISVSGMLFGLLAGIVHADVRALGITLGCLNSVLLFFTGIARPVEESHIIIRTIGTILPITWSIKGLQAIRYKNKYLLESPVLEAFGYNIAFIVAFSLMIFLLIKYKKIGCVQCLATTETTPVTFSLL